MVTPPSLLSIALWQASEHAFWQPDVKAFQNAVFAQPDGCSRFAPLSADNADDCTWNGDAAGPPIYLFGDSNAGHFVDAVAEAGRRLDRPVIVTTTNACPFLDVSLDRLDAKVDWDAACRNFVQGTLAYLVSDAERSRCFLCWYRHLLRVLSEAISSQPKELYNPFHVRSGDSDSFESLPSSKSIVRLPCSTIGIVNWDI